MESKYLMFIAGARMVCSGSKTTPLEVAVVAAERLKARLAKGTTIKGIYIKNPRWKQDF